MHSTLTEHARCLYSDEYRPASQCGPDHHEHYFLEELTFADAEAILAMLRALCPNASRMRAGWSGRCRSTSR
ncbi:hypothetical protein AB0J89_11620 [Micromonospora chokoriensis]